MEKANFTKYEGLGNDFVVIERARAEDFDARLRALVPALCDRRFGIGADGVLVVLPPSDPGAVARMRVINADGSIPEMCGNGLRCVALHLAMARGPGDLDLLVETDAGPRACSVLRLGPGEAHVRVDMGVVRVIERRRIALGGAPGEPDESVDVAVVDAGNPHAVIFRADPARDIDRLGPALAQHASFPSGTNVELVERVGDLLDVLVWERGVGRTLACGTGACAVVAEASATGLVPLDAPVTVRLPGGTLSITHDPKTGRTELDGPARLVFRGDAPSLAAASPR